MSKFFIDRPIFANVIAIVCYSAIILALLILARVKYDWSLDGIIDRMVDAVTPGVLTAPLRVLPDLFNTFGTWPY